MRGIHIFHSFLIFTQALKIEWARKDNTITYDSATYNIVFDFALE